MNALFINTFTRAIQVLAVSVTKVAENHGLVLRYGTTVGTLGELTQSSDGMFNPNMPILLATRGYAARSSAGFVSLAGDPGELQTHVLGVQGMPWQTKKGLSVCSNPIEVFAFPAGTKIKSADTHARREPGKGWHSNTATAEAAVAGIKLRAKIRPNSVFLLEGQSDYAQAWELEAPAPEAGAVFPVPPDEHRGERFTACALAQAFVRRLTPARQLLAFALGVTAKKIEGELRHHVNDVAAKFLGMSPTQWVMFKDGAKEAFSDMVGEGWTYRFSPDGGKSRYETISPSGERTMEFVKIWTEDCWSRYAIESELLSLSGNSDEVNRSIQRMRRAEMLKEMLAESPAGVFQLIPVSWMNTEGTFFRPVEGLKKMNPRSFSEILASPRFEEIANGAEIVFLVAHDKEGNPTDISCQRWWGDHWVAVGLPNAMLKALETK